MSILMHWKLIKYANKGKKQENCASIIVESRNVLPPPSKEKIL